MKKGFTLVELLAVMAIMSLILVLIIPNLSDSGNESKQKMYDTKKESILKAYEMCIDDVNVTTKCDTPYKLITNGYLVSDDLKTTCTEGTCIKNPINNEYLDKCAVSKTGITC